MSDLTAPSSVEEALKSLNIYNRDNIWELPQKRGTFIVKHKALEKVAAHFGIRWSQQKVELADAGSKSVAISMAGTLGDRTEWSVGEASPDNTQQKYLFAMAEKRAKDRVILKLLDAHGDCYTEEDADDFKASEGQVKLNDLVTHNEVVLRVLPSIVHIKKAIAKNDLGHAAQVLDELTQEEQDTLDLAPSKGGIFTTAERELCFRPHGEVRRIVNADKGEAA